MLAIPFPGLGRNTYIDENALQPGQVRRRELGPCSLTFCALRSIPIGTGTMFMLRTSTLLNWKKYVTLISRVNSQSIQSLGLPTFFNSFSRRAQFISTEFLKLGLSSSTQNYAFSASTAVCTLSYTMTTSYHSVSRILMARTHMLFSDLLEILEQKLWSSARHGLAERGTEMVLLTCVEYPLCWPWPLF